MTCIKILFIYQTESIFDTFLAKLPFYYEVKAVFILYLTMPSTQGTAYFSHLFFNLTIDSIAHFENNIYYLIPVPS